MQKYTVKMDCRQRNRQWKVIYFFVDTIVLLRKFVRPKYEKKARAKIDKKYSRMKYVIVPET